MYEIIRNYDDQNFTNKISECIFSHNIAKKGSGIIYAYSPGDLIIEKSIFENNFAQTGTIYCDQKS